MKNIYELSKQDKNKYREEFNKLKFTKDLKSEIILAFFIGIFALIISIILPGLLDNGLKHQEWLDFIDYIVWLFDTFGLIALGLFCILTLYLNIIFIRWMKIKHNVEY